MADTVTVDSRLMPSPPAAPGMPSTRGRMAFLDGLRGLALIFMMVNHTGHGWIDVSMGWPRYYVVYVTVTIAAPIFLFLVGFSLAISFYNAGVERGGTVSLSKYVKRGLRVVLAGYLLNVVIREPWWSWGVLQTIGFSIVLLSPMAALLVHRAAPAVLLGLAAAVYVAFSLSYAGLRAALPAHSVISHTFFGDFPLWPWISMATVGLALSWIWMRCNAAGERERTRFMTAAGSLGVLCFAWYFAFDWWVATSPRFSFTRDFLINRHWTPRGATTAWVFGVVLCSLVLMYYLMEVRQYRFPWLVTLGQTALMLYFVHQVIVFTVMDQLLVVRFHRWAFYALANAVLLVVLVYLGKGWLELKRWVRRSPAGGGGLAGWLRSLAV